MTPIPLDKHDPKKAKQLALMGGVAVLAIVFLLSRKSSSSSSTTSPTSSTGTTTDPTSTYDPNAIDPSLGGGIGGSGTIDPGGGNGSGPWYAPPGTTLPGISDPGASSIPNGSIDPTATGSPDPNASGAPPQVVVNLTGGSASPGSAKHSARPGAAKHPAKPSPTHRTAKPRATPPRTTARPQGAHPVSTQKTVVASHGGASHPNHAKAQHKHKKR